MQINYLSILLATIVQFIIGAIWYMPLFGKLWGKIHGFDKQSKATQEEMMKSMMPLLGVQLFFTLVTSIILYIFIYFLPHDWNVYALAGFFWIGFVVPTQVSAVIFGGTDPKWIVTKIFVMVGASFLCLEAAAIVIHFFI